VDLCWSAPGFDANLTTAIWMGLATVAKERCKVILTGDPGIACSMQKWLGHNPFAVEPKRVSA
jgi:hypothetical protein